MYSLVLRFNSFSARPLHSFTVLAATSSGCVFSIVPQWGVCAWRHHAHLIGSGLWRP